MARPDDLPEFGDPPVDEVIVGAFIESIPSFKDKVAFELLKLLEDDGYSDLQIQAPLFLDDDDPSSPPPRSAQPSLQLMPVTPPRRFWLVSDDERRIVQVQSDALLANWRRRGDATYPRFEAVMASYRTATSAFLATLAASKIDVPSVKQVEVSYTNWIPAPGMHEFFRPSQGDRLTGRHVERNPEAEAWISTYPLHGATGRIGRLRVVCQSASRLVGDTWNDGTQLMLTARMAVSGRTLSDSLDDLLEVGRETIVQAFTDLTTEEAHQLWQRK